LLLPLFVLLIIDSVLLRHQMGIVLSRAECEGGRLHLLLVDLLLDHLVLEACKLVYLQNRLWELVIT